MESKAEKAIYFSSEYTYGQQVENDGSILIGDGLVVTNTSSYPLQKRNSEGIPTTELSKSNEPRSEVSNSGTMTKLQEELFSLVFYSDEDSTANKPRQEITSSSESISEYSSCRFIRSWGRRDGMLSINLFLIT